MRTIAEATVAGFVFAGLWRMWHNDQKAKVDAFYKKYNAELEAEE